jgi:hypothetical protein
MMPTTSKTVILDYFILLFAKDTRVLKSIIFLQNPRILHLSSGFKAHMYFMFTVVGRCVPSIFNKISNMAAGLVTSIARTNYTIVDKSNFTVTGSALDTASG